MTAASMDNEAIEQAKMVDDIFTDSFMGFASGEGLSSVHEHVGKPTPASEKEPIPKIETPTLVIEMPNDPSLLIETGQALGEAGNLQEALERFDRALSIDEKLMFAWYNRAVALILMNRHDEARHDLEVALELSPDHYPSIVNLAILCDHLKDVERAADLALQALDRDPDHTMMLGIAAKAGRLQGPAPRDGPTPAPPMDGRLPEQDAEDETPKVNHDEEEVAAPIPDYNKKATYSDNVLKSVMNEHGIDDAEAVIAAAEVYDDGNRYLNREELAAGAATVALASETGTDLDALVSKATEAIRNGDPKTAYSIIVDALRESGADHVAAWRVAANALARLGADEHAISSFEHAVRLEPNDASTRYNLGLLLRKTGNIERASKQLRSAISTQQDHKKAGIALLKIGTERQNLEDQLLGGRAILANEPSHEHRLAHVRLLLDLATGERRVLEMHGASLPQTLPEAPELAGEAEHHLANATSLDERLMLAEAMSFQNRHPDAVTLLRSLLEVDKEDIRIWKVMADVLTAAGQPEKANQVRGKIEALRGTKDTSIPPPIKMVSSPSAAKADVPVQSDPEADRKVTEMLSTRPTSTPSPRTEPSETKVSVDLAAAALEAAALVEAKTGIQTVSSSVSNQDVEWYNRGLGLLGDGKHKEALSCFDKALAAFVDDDTMIVRVLNARGSALYMLDEFAGSIESYMKAIQIDPASATGQTLYNMGAAYAEIERYDDAIRCFEQAIPRGLAQDASARAKENIRSCHLLKKEKARLGR